MKKIIYIFVLTFIIISCKKNNQDQGINKENIQPLEVGYSWVYEDSYFSPEGQLLGTDTTTLGITGKTTIQYDNNDIEVYYWNWTSYPTYEFNEEKWLCNNINNELFHYGGIVKDSLFIFEKSLAAKIPSYVNENWTRSIYHFSVASFYNAGTATVVCKSTNELFKTALGDLHCYRYDEKRVTGEDTLMYETYYCSNIGFVGVIIKRNETIEMTKKLISYDLTPSKSIMKKFPFQKKTNIRAAVDNLNVNSKIYN